MSLLPNKVKVPTSFHELATSLCFFQPFKYYPFMCATHPFYFDVQDKLSHLAKETYRFRASLQEFYLDRSTGISLALFHSGLKQSIKMGNFLIYKTKDSFSRVAPSKDYLYLLYTDFNSQYIDPLWGSRRDWFYGSMNQLSYSPLFYECLYSKHGRRFWRPHLAASDSVSHLRLESLFYISGLSATNLLGELPYQGPSTSSYHFSFLSNSPDKRTLLRSPTKFFSFKNKCDILKKTYKFSLFHNFYKPVILTINHRHFNSFFLQYSFSMVFGSLLLLFYYYCIFFNQNRPSIDYIFTRQGLSCVSFSSINFYMNTKRKYFYPRMLLHKMSLKYPYFRSPNKAFVTRRLTLIDMFKPYIKAPILIAKNANKILSKKRAQRKLFNFYHYIALNRRNYWASNMNWSNERFNAKLMRYVRYGLVRRKLHKRIFRLLSKSPQFSWSLRQKLFSLISIQRLFKAYENTPNFFRALFPKHLRRLPLYWNNTIQKRRWRKRRPKKSVVAWKSSFLLNIKFLLVNLFFIFLRLYKSNFLMHQNDASNISFSSFSGSVIVIMYKYFSIYNLFSSYAQFFRSSKFSGYAVNNYYILNTYKELVLKRWLERWNFAYSALQQVFLAPFKEAKKAGFYYRILINLRFNLWRHFLKLFKLLVYCRKSYFINIPISPKTRRKQSLRRLFYRRTFSSRFLRGLLPSHAYSSRSLIDKYRVRSLRKLRKYNFKTYLGTFHKSRKLLVSKKAKKRSGTYRITTHRSKPFMHDLGYRMLKAWRPPYAAKGKFKKFPVSTVKALRKISKKASGNILSSKPRPQFIFQWGPSPVPLLEAKLAHDIRHTPCTHIDITPVAPSLAATTRVQPRSIKKFRGKKPPFRPIMKSLTATISARKK